MCRVGLDWRRRCGNVEIDAALPRHSTVIFDNLVDDLAEVARDVFDAKLSVLKEEIRHHARDEEEGKLFPKLRRMFTKDELAGLGNELMAMFENLIEMDPRNEVPMQTRAAAELELGL